MFAKAWMITRPVTVDVIDTVPQAIRRFTERNEISFPVESHARLEGLAIETEPD
jgi:hypothetical protein